MKQPTRPQRTKLTPEEREDLGRIQVRLAELAPQIEIAMAEVDALVQHTRLILDRLDPASVVGSQKQWLYAREDFVNDPADVAQTIAVALDPPPGLAFDQLRDVLLHTQDRRSYGDIIPAQDMRGICRYVEVVWPEMTDEERTSTSALHRDVLDDLALFSAREAFAGLLRGRVQRIVSTKRRAARR